MERSCACKPSCMLSLLIAWYLGIMLHRRMSLQAPSLPLLLIGLNSHQHTAAKAQSTQGQRKAYSGATGWSVTIVRV